MTSGSSFSAKREPGDDVSPIAPYGVPDNEVPAVLALERVIGASAGVVFFLAGMRVYSNGIEFDLEARLRPGASIGEADGIYALLPDFHGPHGTPADRLLLGVEFADGRRASSIGVADSGIGLRSNGSSGGGRSAHATYFLSPLPPPGDVRIVCALPGAGIDETVTVIDGAAILEAAGRVRELWPWEPERHEPRRPVRPVVPAGGWFTSFADPEGS